MAENTDLLKLLQFTPKSLQHPDAWVGHMPFAYWLIQKLRPSTFVELGTHTGNSYFSFCQSIQENNIDSKAYAVDTWEGDAHAGYYDESVFTDVHQINQSYSAFSTLLRTTFDSASEYFEDGSVDLLHIDGLHTYEAVKHDFETWLPKISDKGVVLFHDTNVRRDDFGVYRLWSELSKEYNSLEFYHSHGLGILEFSSSANSILPANESERLELREMFSLLSSQMLIRFERDSLVSERDSLIKSNPLRFGSSGVQDHGPKLSEEILPDNELSLARLNEELVRSKYRETILEKSLVSRIQSIHQSLDELSNELDRTSRDLRDVYRSRSWRLTRPLRAAASFLRKLRA